MPARQFFDNVGACVAFALFNTGFNIAAIGMSFRWRLDLKKNHRNFLMGDQFDGYFLSRSEIFGFDVIWVDNSRCGSCGRDCYFWGYACAWFTIYFGFWRICFKWWYFCGKSHFLSSSRRQPPNTKIQPIWKLKFLLLRCFGKSAETSTPKK